MSKDDSWTYVPGDRAVYDSYETEFETERSLLADAFVQLENDTDLPQIHHCSHATFAAATPPSNFVVKGANFGSDELKCLLIVQGNAPIPAKAGLTAGQAEFDIDAALGTPYYWALDAGLVTAQVLVLGAGFKSARSKYVSIVLT